MGYEDAIDPTKVGDRTRDDVSMEVTLTQIGNVDAGTTGTTSKKIRRYGSNLFL
jgi:hypothetical protein